MKIYITRHGETEWNEINKMQGWQNSNLTEKGIEDAIKLSERLKEINFSNIYSSPLGRALDTANYIKRNRDIEIEIHEGLKEMGFGLWEGLEDKSIREFYEEEHYNYWNKPELYKPNRGESFEELFKRIDEVLEDIIKNAIGENILIVSHGIAIKGMFAIIKDFKLGGFWKLPYIDGTSLSILEVDKNNMKFILEGDTSHFKG